MKPFNYFTVLCVLLMGSGCDDFLDIAPKSNQPTAGFFSTEDEIEQAVVGVYDALQFRSQYGENFAHFMEMRSDNSTIQDAGRSGSRYGNFYRFRLGAGNLVVKATWEACYKGIQRCNTLLNRIGGVDMDEDLRSRRTGEVKFIRALTYFNMVRIWGDVPLEVKEVEDPLQSFGQVRAPASEVYEQIIKDLTEASEAGLPASDATGRVTDVAVKTLLGKVYLTLGRFGDAVPILQNVVNGGTHELLPDFADVFDINNENNKESIFEVQFSEASNEGSAYPNLYALRGKTQLVGGVGGAIGDNVPTDDLINAYAAADTVRLSVSFGQIDGTYYTKKYMDVPLTPNNSDRNCIVLRYADVLLMLAEALNETGYNANGPAFEYLNQVRARAKIGTLTSAELPNQEDFRTAVLLERRLELAQENHRWLDLVRTNTAISTMADQGITVAPYQLLYPIPQAQIDTDPVITQNPGY